MAVLWRASAAALLLATGCRGFPCTDDVGFPDDETFVSFVPAREWASDVMGMLAPRS